MLYGKMLWFLLSFSHENKSLFLPPKKHLFKRRKCWLFDLTLNQCVCCCGGIYITIFLLSSSWATWMVCVLRTLNKPCMISLPFLHFIFRKYDFPFRECWRMCCNVHRTSSNKGISWTVGRLTSQLENWNVCEVEVVEEKHKNWNLSFACTTTIFFSRWSTSSILPFNQIWTQWERRFDVMWRNCWFKVSFVWQTDRRKEKNLSTKSSSYTFSLSLIFDIIDRWVASPRCAMKIEKKIEASKWMNGNEWNRRPSALDCLGGRRKRAKSRLTHNW